ncbi:PREDICTED: uncharacterized protein LOC104826097 [Tarenaya hassleriana]|uniref:uncharacterized protein LOC104826097 n=1 Tax=Tarenaya hassleriana TaxID=28532 RepID=UPI00053C38D9|nr:PREDICTED: uncharacterized protein LOC104826097 [Tarenaya hassleriana]
MSMFPSFQLLELNIISAQDLAPVSRKMKTYAIAWVNSERRLATRVDYSGGSNPTWNDKFVFRVNEEFLYADTSAVMIEIYALHWFRDVHVGTVRVLISNLIPPSRRPGYRTGNNEYRRSTPPPGMRFVALQVRRTSGRPQGILNIGVGLLDGSMRSMPLYTHMDSSAVGYRDLLGEEDPHLQHLHLNSHKGSSKNPQSPASRQYQSVVSKPELRRTKSDTSSMVVSDLLSRAERSRAANKKPASTLASSNSETVPTTSEHDTTSSSNTEAMKSIKDPSSSKTPKTPRKRYHSIDLDVIDPPMREDLYLGPPRKEKPNVTPHGSYNPSRKTPGRTPMREKHRPAKDYGRSGASPYLSRNGTPLRSNIVESTPIRSNMVGSTPMRSIGVGSTPMRSNIVASTPMRSNIVGSTPLRSTYMATPMKSNFGTPMRPNMARRPILTESELGPSPSEVMEKMEKERSNPNDTESSILSEWSIEDGSIEGLRSKLERWRTELPPLYDLGSSHLSSEMDEAAGGKSSRRKTPAMKTHSRRHTDGGNGLFSCFSNICGVECTFACGGSDPDGSKKKKGASGRVHRTASSDNLSYL